MSSDVVTSALGNGAVGDPSVTAEGVGKTFKLGEEDRVHNELLSERLGDLLRRAGRPRRRDKAPYREERETLVALEDVSFEFRHGEAIGLIGRNGAGKSTLLKVLSRITPPSSGRITMRGRVATLLEVGTGFHPELTGRENVYLNGSILGMRRAEIDSKFDEIVEFSGIERFLDTPVKRFSSGMYVRLAFAVAAHLEPEILLVDEVLAVGDEEFQKRCLGKLQDIAGEGRTVVFVSHNLYAIERLCNRALLLDGGRLVHDGSPAEVIAEYLDRVEARHDGGSADFADDPEGRVGSGEVRLSRIEMTDEEGQLARTITVGQRFRIRLAFTVREQLDAAIEIGIWTVNGQRIATALSADRRGPAIPMSPGDTAVNADFTDLTLVPGEYLISIHVRRASFPPLDYVERALRFTVMNPVDESADRYRWPVLPSVRPRTTWLAEGHSSGTETVVSSAS